MTRKYTEKELRAHLKTIPYNDDVWTKEDLETGRVKYVGKGHAAAIVHHKSLVGRPKVADKKVLVSLRLRESSVKKLKGLGRGWQTMAGEYLMKGINSGKVADLRK
ncbi:MAG: BrnA antitoxin family protein [Alphaproteobacteria bacterium]|nr:BrnA antitoxin family protein [Alphaproteobacteria bacterium]MCL2505726.1 BrnA antitoxin family protein [Alphaproteobacteria bacterium]